MKSFCWLVLLVFLLPSCKQDQTPYKISFAGEAQGTYYAITYYDAQNRNLKTQTDSLLQAFDLSVSLWVPNSIISRVNRGDSLVRLNEIFTNNFNLSKQIAEQTNGYFDFTISPLVEAWGFSFKEKIVLNKTKIDSIKMLVNWKNVSLFNDKVIKTDPRIRFDFNAIAQGYSVDLIGQFLESKGITRYLVDVGGEIKANNIKADGTKWRIGIEKPALEAGEDRSIQQVIELQDKSLATSGSYRKYYEENGKRYSHAIDPKTGYPVNHNLLSVTVVATTTAEADAYATAFLVMGLDKSKALIPQLPAIDAYFISWDQEKGFVIDMTAGFQDYLQPI
ncbi:MAG: FAD:protein FMN transferase [Bacteroidales bacterium]|jgi:thiamine biosynthesis lipoprotein|nr:FAD:protein FMN transferase [Bacteroidales bacterium]HOI32319.1 FAD:protein FMN transferase [Bacteroidales bacterium]